MTPRAVPVWVAAVVYALYRAWHRVLVWGEKRGWVQ